MLDNPPDPFDKLNEEMSLMLMSFPALDCAATPEPLRVRFSPLTKFVKVETELRIVVDQFTGLEASILRTLGLISNVIFPLII